MVRTSLESSASNSSKKRPKPSSPKSKKPNSKKKNSQAIKETLFVRTIPRGDHIAYSTKDPDTIVYIAPPDVSRADGDMDRSSPDILDVPYNGHPISTFKQYNFENPIKWKLTRAEDRYAELTEARKAPIPLIYVDKAALEELKVYEEVHSTCVNSGLNFPFRDDPGTYPKVTMEFFCYFEPIFEQTSEGISGVSSWTFCLGDHMWDIEANVIRDWLRLPRDGYIPEVDDREVVKFWRDISGCDYVDNHDTSSIVVKKWRVIHRIIGSNIFVRTNRGRVVSKLEVTIMSLMERGQKIDWLWCITQGLLDNRNPKGSNRSLGGGSIVTLMAKKLRYTFGDGEPLRESFTLDKMRFMSIIGKGNSWNVEKKTKGKGKAVEDSEPSKSSIAASLESINRTMARHFKWQEKHNKWQQESLLLIASYQKIYLNPPPALDEEAGIVDSDEPS